MTNPLDRLAGWWLDRSARRNAARLPDLEIHKVEIVEGHLEVIASHPAILELASEAATMLRDVPEAKNYIQFDMMPRADHAIRPVRVTVQWASGMSPAQMAQTLQVELERSQREHGWMRRLILGMDSTHWMKWVEGPWFATGDMDELAFFRTLRDERLAAASEDKDEEQP